MVGNLYAVQFLQKANIEEQDLVISFEIISFYKIVAGQARITPLY